MNSHYRREERSRKSTLSFMKGCWILLAVGFGLSMTYLWLYSHVMEASNSLKSFENKLSYLRGRSLSLQSRLANLQTPEVIIRRLEEFQIALVDPYSDQIVRIRQQERAPVKEIVHGRPPRDLVILSIAR
ncbi:MAG: hypothetical protein RAO92_05620 [Candidatus Euphemobacter frigidus]|nr:hypothetical protein [Candidatus Euphemobacter frigidus]MDP8275862.1 hypothetical protein [Candidatus Euphemobacter frigidus]